jgi:hypothetical protein
MQQRPAHHKVLMQSQALSALILLKAAKRVNAKSVENAAVVTAVVAVDVTVTTVVMPLPLIRLATQMESQMQARPLLHPLLQRPL